MVFGALIGLATQIVPGIIDLAKGGKKGEAAPAEAKGGAGPAEGAGAGPAKAKKDPATRIRERFAQARSPQEVDQIKQQVLQKIEAKGKDKDGKLKALVENVANETKQRLGAGGAAPMPAGAGAPMPAGAGAPMPAGAGGAAMPAAAGGAPMPAAAGGAPMQAAAGAPMQAGAAGQPDAGLGNLLAQLDPQTLNQLTKKVLEKVLGPQAAQMSPQQLAQIAGPILEKLVGPQAAQAMTKALLDPQAAAGAGAQPGGIDANALIQQMMLGGAGGGQPQAVPMVR